jgi:hypothetical protein
MASSITQGKTYIPYLDQAYKIGSLTSVLDAGESLVKMGENGKDILIAKTTLVGLGTSSRAGDYQEGDVTFAWETHTPSYDRNRMFKVDAMDEKETQGLAFSTIAGEFIRTKVVPEVDAYRFATYAATTNISTVNGATLANAAEVTAALRVATNTMDEDEVPVEGRYLFITPTLLGYLQDQATTESREILTRFAGIVAVPQTRFYTQIDLATGASNTASGGYIKNSAAGKDINFMIVQKDAVVQAAKHIAPKIVTPEQNPDADAWKFGYRIYGIASVQEQKVDGIYLHKKA